MTGVRLGPQPPFQRLSLLSLAWALYPNTDVLNPEWE